MARRIVIEEECEHGVGPDESCGVQICDHPHASRHRIYTKRCHCPGGSRRVLDPGEVLKGVYVAGSLIEPTRYATVQDVLNALAVGSEQTGGDL